MSNTKANIELKLQGVRGQSPKLQKQGSITMFLDNPKPGCYIYADAYIGQGLGYQNRENTIIEIREDYNVLFSGTYAELCNKLKG